MISLRILVLEDRLPRRKVITRALTELGVRAIFLAPDGDKALDLITRAEGVDVVICDLSNEKPGCFNFLMAAGRARLVNALILGSALEPQFLRALECINQSSQIRLIGVLGDDAPRQALDSILRVYLKHRTFAPLLTLDGFKLPTESEVRNALESREFKAWFQPKFDLRSGALCGVEALARWEHPTRGLLLPGEFLPAVLAYDLIDEMFKQVFAQGLDLLVSLRGRNISLQVAFNLHASQLARFDLAMYIENALIEHDLPGSALMFELAENGLLDMPVVTQKSLLCLRLLGCDLSIDDFGTGFSSLTLLCQLPFQELKLDSSVVQDLSDLRSRAMMLSTIALARALEINLVIEGVSTQAIRDQALDMGGTFAQGFHLAKPMSASRLKEWLE
ncbi:MULTISPECIES: EAL domain-containing protein [unclassified Pseudomonas]|uniref:EAL domain-containing response regulator n=1 Tax=unclassified Pseudomonas TaxID=196821 RepID=UPI0015A33E8E|nr:MULTISPECIES: EAL domain-containing response regulator [unclassified Pseudomonas]NWC93105.1 EAL domain-containing response regulator [Pseudomonas sp. IPO3779]NWD19523.1 EAL domain-containing response regulator [Pseudomonas sp. IPO3778]